MHFCRKVHGKFVNYVKLILLHITHDNSCNWLLDLLRFVNVTSSFCHFA